MPFYNPFVRRETHANSALITYRVLVPISWILVVVTGIYYSVRSPDDVKHGHRLFKQANKHETPFSQNIYITGIYWVLLLLSQISYVVHLFSRDAVLVAAAANVASHFVLNNLFVFAWILLWVRNHFWGSEIILAAHFINQNVTYWRNRCLPTFVHLPAVAGPYAWTLTALFWNGAVAVHSNGLPARIVANIFIWVILVIGGHAVVVNQDYLLADCMSLLTLSLAIKQFDIKIISLQWIFAFVVFALFVVSTFYTSTTRYYGRDSLFRRIVEPEATVDRERQPLLDDQAA